jgi:hypothetical protein
VNAADSNSGKIAWGPWLIGISGVVLFLVGSVCFVLKHRFGPIDAVYCYLAVVAAGFFLLVCSYVLQHAKVASMIPSFPGRNHDFFVSRDGCCARTVVVGSRSRSCVRGMEKQKGSAPNLPERMVAGMRKARSVMRTNDFCDPLTLGWIHCQLPPKNGDGK